MMADPRQGIVSKSVTLFPVMVFPPLQNHPDRKHMH
jgi:hypothetical protein